ncbi:MAG TPA: prephenate dehydrogenase/arogenate dehydrogenase family protein [Terriglobales bacterium]|nr:prephenate dehydrogenase/arogenate dehydrogenase family protein [Terriglobales bacterium]
MEIRQITIIGTGLIGGSLGLALKKHGFAGRVVGCDRPLVLAQAKRIGAIDIGMMDLKQAVYASDVILLATPVGAVLDLIEQVGPMVPDHVLLTDVASTKRDIVQRAQSVFGGAAQERFLAGHPMAGKERGGVEQADADLFQGAVWLVAPTGKSVRAGQEERERGRDARATAGEAAGATTVRNEWLWWVERIGARIVVIDADRHDKLCAWVSHLPQMMATALAASLEDEFGDDPELQAIGGRALREMTRIAASPYSMWRDIAFTNTANIEDALMRLEQTLAHIRENLRTRALQEEFEKGNRFRRG